MKTEYLDELYPFQLKEKLLQLGVELTDEQYRILSNCERTFLYSPRKKKKKGVNVLFRMSIILYIFWFMFVRIVIQPIKWIVTGYSYFDTDNPIYKFTVKWGRKIGL